MYNIIYETSRQSRFNARYWMLGAGALGRPRGMVWGGRREEGSGWETHVCLWRIHFDIWQNQYHIVKFKKKKNKTVSPDTGSGHSRGRPGFNSLNLITGGSQPSGAMTQELLTYVAPRSASSRFPAMSWVKESFSLMLDLFLIYFIRPRCLLPSLGVPITKYSTHWPEGCSGPNVRMSSGFLCSPGLSVKEVLLFQQPSNR